MGVLSSFYQFIAKFVGILGIGGILVLLSAVFGFFSYTNKENPKLFITIPSWAVWMTTLCWLVFYIASRNFYFN